MATYNFAELFKFEQPYSRGRYWAVRLSVLGVALVVYGLFMFLGAVTHPLIGFLYIPVGMVGTWVAFVTTIKRLRDCDASVYFSLLNLVPLVNIITFIVFGCIPSNKKKNKSSATGAVITACVIYACFMLVIPVIGVGAYMVYNQQNTPMVEEMAIPEAAPAPMPAM